MDCIQNPEDINSVIFHFNFSDRENLKRLAMLYNLSLPQLSVNLFALALATLEATEVNFPPPPDTTM